MGIAADRFGVRPVALLSVALFGLSFMALGLSNGSLPLYYLTWLLIAFFGVGTLPITWTRAVNNAFQTGKGLALGLSLIGTGLFGYIIKPLASWLIADFGWRWAFVAIGALPLLIALPLGLAGFRDPSQGVIDPRQRRAAAAAAAALIPGLTMRQTVPRVAILADRRVLRVARLRRGRIDPEHGEHPQDCRISSMPTSCPSPR